MTNKRKALHAYLSDEAHERWQDYAANGISVSALLEALAQVGFLASEPQAQESVVERAHLIDSERRSHKRS
jgi:hypothetical protein